MPIIETGTFTRCVAAILLGALTLSLLVCEASASSFTSTEHYVGHAFAMDGHPLYTESQWITGAPGKRKLLVLFNCLDGKPFARKRVEEDGFAQRPLFTLEDARSGYREGVRRNAEGSLEVFHRKDADEPEKSAPLSSDPDLVVDVGFDSFIHTRWEALSSGDPQSLKLVLPNRLQSYPFTLAKVDETAIDGNPALRFSLELDAWYAFAIPAISLTYSMRSKQILEYTGVASVRDSHGKSLKVRIEFPLDQRSVGTDTAGVDEADAAVLDGGCPL